MQPGTVEIPLADISAKAQHRPPGYIDRVLSMGMVIGDRLVICKDKLEELRAEFGGPSKGGGGCCGS